MARRGKRIRHLVKKLAKGGLTKKEQKRITKRFGINKTKVGRILKSINQSSKLKSNNAMKVGQSGVVPYKNAAQMKKALKKPSAFQIPNQAKTGLGPLTSLRNAPKKMGKITPPDSDLDTPNINLKGLLKSILDRDLSNRTPDLTIDSKLDPNKLTPTITGANNELDKMAAGFDKNFSDYQKQIDALNKSISGYKADISGYKTDITDMAGELKKTIDNNNKFTPFLDTQYLGNNSAGGVRLRRSKKFRKGDFALGTAGLRRENRAKLKVSNVNQ